MRVRRTERARRLAPVRIGDHHTPLSVLVLDELRRQILTGEREPGTRLIEEQVAKDLSVSRNPVRDAIHALAAEGLVDINPRRGAIVGTVTAEDALHMFEVRATLESLGAQLAASRATPADIAELYDLLELNQQKGESLDVALSRQNTAFHAAIHRISGNSYLIELMRIMTFRLEWVFRQNAIVRRVGSLEEHRAIVQAIEAGDEPLAASLAREHVNAARRAYLDNAQPDDDPSDATWAGGDRAVDGSAVAAT